MDHSKLEFLQNSDLGPNVYRLFEKAAKVENGLFVDLGVREGVSSEIFLLTSNQGNKVLGVDVDWGFVNPNVVAHPNYTMRAADSVTVGKYFNHSVNGLFVDTFHIKEQVLCELYFWFEKIVEGGFVAFHDSNWPPGKCDIYGGKRWGRVEEGIKQFFQIQDLNYEDDYIVLEHYPESWGMTIATVKAKKDYKALTNEWSAIFKRRNDLISLFWNESNASNIVIELEINPE